MIRLASIFVIVFGMMSNSFAQTIRAASWNIRCIEKKDSLQGDAWSKRVPEIAKVVEFRNFDVLGMQEVDSVQREMLSALMPRYSWIKAANYEGNPIAFLTEKYELKDHGSFWYSRSMEVGSKDWDSKHPRHCNWVRLVDKASGKDFLFVNTHWDNKGDTARVESARMVVKLLPQIAGDSPTILVGDFNLKPKRTALRILTADSVFYEAVDMAPIVSIPEGSFTKFRTDRHSEETLDHMFYRGPLKILRYGILRETYYDGEQFRFPSDHHPIMGEFKIE